MGLQDTIDQVYGEKYPELCDKLKEVGIVKMYDLEEKIEKNPKYFHEVFEYSIIENEKIVSICKNWGEKATVAGNFIWRAIVISFILLVLAFLIINIFF